MRELNIQEIESVSGATDTSSPSPANGCYYNNNFYSPGAVVNMGGTNFQCGYNGAYGGYNWEIYK